MVLKGLAGTLGLWLVGAIALRAVVVPAQVCPALTPAGATAAADAAAGWSGRVQYPDGTYLYEYSSSDDSESPFYNVVRHAGVTMSLYQLAATGDRIGLATADNALGWMRANLYRRDDWAALQNPADESVEVGGTALMLAGIMQRRMATNETTYDTLAHELARYLLVMQQADGSFLLFYDEQTGAPRPGERSKYATGEAFYALTLMHKAFPGEGWDVPSRKVADYLSLHRDDYENQKFPPWADQWAAYGLAEMADWPLDEANVAYARSLAERFGFLVRVESQRRDNWFSDVIHGRQARGAGMGTWVEGLSSLYRLASIDPRMADMRPKIAERAACGAGMLAARQITAEKAKTYPRPSIAEGAWFTKGVTRMDDQQHTLSGILYTRPILEALER